MGGPGMTDIDYLLGDEAADLLQHACRTIPREGLHVPSADFIDITVA